MKPVINQHGRAWDEFDSLRAQALIAGAFSLCSEDGVPLCGRQIDDEAPATLVANGWHRKT